MLPNSGAAGGVAFPNFSQFFLQFPLAKFLKLKQQSDNFLTSSCLFTIRLSIHKKFTYQCYLVHILTRNINIQNWIFKELGYNCRWDPSILKFVPLTCIILVYKLYIKKEYKKILQIKMVALETKTLYCRSKEKTKLVALYIQLQSSSSLYLLQI